MARDHRRQRQDAAAVGVQRGRVAASCTRRWPTTSCPEVGAALEGVELVGDERARAIVGAAIGHATDDDFAHRVPRPEAERGASSTTSTTPSTTSTATAAGHTEAIVTGDLAAADRFTREVDAAAVVVNASTRFVDGEEFGFGAEIGISTQKLHARGPDGPARAHHLKYVVHGDGQTRS